MAQRSRSEDAKGVQDALRTAVERTFAATAGGAAGTRERAAEALDEVTRRGREAIAGMRLASRDDVRELSERIDKLSRRVAELEADSKVQR